MKAKSLKILNSALILIDEYDCESQFNLLDNHFRITFEATENLFSVEELTKFSDQPGVQSFPLDYRDPGKVEHPDAGKYFPVFSANEGKGKLTPIGIAVIMDINTDDEIAHRQEVIYDLSASGGGVVIGMVSGLTDVLIVVSPPAQSEFGPKLRQEPL